MLKLLSNLKRLLAAGLVLVPAVTLSAENPIISFHTQVYDNVGPENAFHFYIGSTETTTIKVDCGFGPEEIEVQQAVYDPASQSVMGTMVVCSVDEAATVNIYGDASLIDYLDLEGIYIDQISFPDLTNLEILNLNHNELAALDLTPYSKLQAIYVNDNPFGTSPLKIGPDKPELAILEMSIIGHLDQSFALTDYPALQIFRAFNCKELREVDPSQCPELLVLTVDVTSVSSVDVSNNPKLLILNVSDTHVKTVDVSTNTQLQQLFCSHTGQFGEDSRLQTLDVTNNPELIYLFCAGNELSTLDISHNPKLITLSAYTNNFTELDFNNNPALVEVDIHNNYMDYITLPEPRSTFIEYYYSQRPFAMERSYVVGTELDFSDKVNRPGTTTTGVLCRTDEYGYSQELDPSYYNWEDGKITLNKVFNDSVHVVFTNTLFNEYELQSARFMVKSEEDYGKPSAMLSFGVPSSVSDVTFSVGVAGATEEAPVPFFVNFGDGNQLEFSAASETLPTTANVEGTRAGRITIYIPEGHDITAFGINGIRLTSVDLAKARTLRYLEMTGAGLSQINLDNNTLLRSINLADNEFATIDIFGGDFNFKNKLDYLNLSGNKLVEYELRGQVHTVDLSANLLTSVSGLGGVQVNLDLSNNNLSSVNLSDCGLLESINLSGNQFTGIDFSGAPLLKSVDISNNKLLFGAMPEDGAFDEYIYAPQAKYVLAAEAPMADLTDLCYPAVFSESVFTWMSAETGQPVPPGKIRQKKGVFYFDELELGTIYCSVSNRFYPEFTGENALTTTPVKVVDFPTEACATFVTSTDQRAEIILAGVEDGTTIYIDWTGEGDISQYILGTTYKIFPVSTKAGAQVKVLAYDENNGISVFSLDGVTLSSIDASGLTQATTFGLYGSGIKDGKYTLPASSGLQELSIYDSNITSIDLSSYPALYMLNLSGNNLSSLDVSSLPNLGLCMASNNIISDVTFDNQNLWNVDLSQNELESIDLSGTPALNQLDLSRNKLSAIDVSSLNQLYELKLDFNYFTFATLPPVSGQYYTYYYWNQYPMNVEQVDGYVDLSSQAVINGTETIYFWYKGVPGFDDYGQLTGDLLEDGGDYFIEDGITGFYEPFTDVMCVMINSRFPLLYLYTNLIDVEDTGLSNVSVDGGVNAYIDGSAIVVKADADVDVNVYAVSGVEMARTSTVEGYARIEGLVSGVYVVRAGDRVFKLSLR